MGLLDFLFGKTKSIEDDFFGKMIFIEPHFECRRNFYPTDSIIEIGIDGVESGPTIRQKDFFKNIEEKYPDIVKSISPLIEDEFRNWKEEFQIKDFKKEFKPVYLYIPTCESSPVIWEIAFESEHDLNHHFTITMNDFDAKEILIDG
jgi:hypothetical protein